MTGGIVLLDVAEGAAVSHGLDRGAGCLVEAEEVPDADPVHPVALGGGVFACAARGAVHDGLGNQQAVDDMAVEGFVGIQVIALPDAQGRVLLGGEVEAGVDLVLAVGEEEFHRWAALACMWVRMRKLDNSCVCRGRFST